MQADNNHEAAAEILIGAAMDQPTDHLPAIRARLSNPELWPVARRGVFGALVKLADSNRPLTAEIVAHESGVDVDRLLKWQAVGVSVTAQEVDENCRIVTERGKDRLAEEAKDEFSRTKGKVTSADRRARLAQRLSEIDSIETTQRASDGKSRIDRLDEMLNAPPALGARTGLGMLDAWTWNFRPGASTVLAAAYKQRKSTLLRNIVLGTAGNGAAVSVAALEDSVEKFDADCIAMIANALLLGGYIKGCSFSEDPIKLSGDSLMFSREWRKSKGQSPAYERAKSIYKALPIYVYGTKDGVRDPYTLKAKFRKDVTAHNARLLAIDYIQLVRFPGEGIYDRMLVAADWLTMLPIDFNAHVMVLAQRNEESVKGGGGYSPGIKGGGDLPAGAHSTLITSYDWENTANVDELKVELKLSRMAWQGQKEVLIIEPNSGLVTGWRSNATGKRGTISLLPPSLLAGGEQSVIPFTQAAASAPSDDDDGMLLNVA